MLGKLMKYEMKACMRIFLPLYGALILMSIVAGILYSVFDMTSSNVVISVINMISGLLFGILIIAVAVATVLVLIARFYTNLMGEEGYLMFTLPVTANSHILTKLFSGLIWSISSIVVIAFAIVLTVTGADFIQDIGMGISNIMYWVRETGMNPALWVVMVSALILLAIASSIMQFYAAMSVGPHITKNRLIGSFIAYVAIYIALQIIATIMLLTTVFSAGMLNGGVVMQSSGINPFDGLPTMSVIMIYGTVLFNFLVCYFITHFMLKRKLNLA